MAKTLSKKQKELLTLALTVEKGKKGDAELLLLKLIHQVQEIAKGEKGDSIKGDAGHSPTDTELRALITPLIPPPLKPTDGKDGHTPTKEEITALIPDPIPGVPGISGKDGSPDTAGQVRDKLEELKGNERLSISAINNLQEILDELRKMKRDGSIVYVPSGSSGGGKTVKLYDLSDQLNGLLKTFSLPAFWRVVNVTSSSFPNAFRPSVDYTVDGSNYTITFTSEITATSTLATGQTLLVEYAE